MFGKKIFVVFILVIVSLLLAAPVFCFEGKVVKIEEASVMLEVAGPMPPWVKKGALASTSSGLAKVTNVEEKTIEMKVRSSTAAALKLGETLDVKPKDANPSQMLQGC